MAVAALEARVRELETAATAGNERSAASADERVVSARREAAEAASALLEARAEIDRTTKRKTYTDVHLSQIRDQYNKSLEQLAARVRGVGADR